MSDWYEQALANAKKKDAEKRKKEDALAKSPKYQNEQLKGQVYAGSTASDNKPKTEPKSAKEALKTMAGDGKTTNKLDNKKKQQNKKAAAVGATSAAKSSSVKKTTGYKKSAVNTDTLKATKKIAESQEKKLPTKRNGSGKASVQKKEAAKKTLQALKEASKPTVKTAENYDPNPYTKEKIDAMFNQIATDDSLYGKFGRAYTGFSQGVIDAALGTANLVGSKLTGKDINLQERTGLNIDHEGLRNTKGFKGGQVAGEVAGYMMQGVAADPAMDALLAGTKLAKMSGKAGTAAKILGRNAIESGTIGLAQNLGMAHQQGLEGADFAKDVALNTALDFAAGSTLGGVAAGLAAKGAKKGDDLAKAVARIEEAPADTPKPAVKAVEPVTEVAEEVIPKIEEVPVQASSARSRDKLRTASKPKEDVGYHAGDLGKSESYGQQMGSKRDTGHFGTGTYFVGDKVQIDGYNAKNGVEAPKHKVKFSEYNLYKPADKADGEKLHRTLQEFNQTHLNLNDYADIDADKLVDEIESGKWGSESEKYFNSIDAETKDYLYRSAELELEKAKAKTDGQIEAEVYQETRKGNIDGSESLDDIWEEEAFIEIETKNRIEANRKYIEEFDFEKEMRKLALEEWEYSGTASIYNTVHNAQKAKGFIKNDLLELFPNKSIAEIDEAVENAIEATLKYPKNLDAYKLDSASTLLMKNLGYNGIDVRHIPELDNTTYGSVIYDLNAKKSKPLPKADTTRKPPRATERKDISQAREDLMQAEMKYEFTGDDAMEGEVNMLTNRLETAENRRLDRGVDGRKLSNPSTVELPKTEPQFKGTGNRKLKPGGADLAREAEPIKTAREKYGVFEGSDVPKATELGDVQQGARSIRNSDIVQGDEEAIKHLEEGIRQGDYWKTTIKNKDVLASAGEKIRKNGLEKETTIFQSIMSEGRQTKSEDIARGYLLAQEYVKLKDYDMVESILADVSAMESEAGRTLQAMRIFSQLSPLGRMKGAKRTAERLMAERGIDIKINQKLLDDIANATTDADIAKANEAFAIDVWNQIPATLSEKLNAWRYLAMLGNPKTHIRNFVGNLIGVPARQISNTLAAGIEKAFKKKINKLSGGEVSGSKAVFSGKYKDLAEEAYKKNKDALEAVHSKFNEYRRPSGAKLYKTKPLETLRKSNTKALEWEDNIFKKGVFKKSFAQYCAANKVDLNHVTDEVMEAATNYAHAQALKATYQDPNMLADAISKFKRKFEPTASDSKAMKIGKTIGHQVVESTLPFVKTPANILKRGFEYSPAGVAGGIAKIASAKTAEDLMKGIEYFSQGITGTGLIGLGLFLGHRGIVNGSMGEYDKEYAYKQMLGEQDYAVTVGDYTYTLDWMSPLAMPFFVGVEASNVLDGSDDKTLWAVIESFSHLTEPVFEMSMLSGIETTFDTTFTSDSKVKTIIENSMQGYISQFVPTLAGQIARTITPERKVALSTAETKTERNLDKYIDKLENKLPGITEVNEPYIDQWGRTDGKKTNGDYLLSAAENFLSPGYISKKNLTSVDKEVSRLYDKLGETDGAKVIPAVSSTAYEQKFEGKAYRMTESEFTEYKKTVGSYRHAELQKLFKTEEYKTAPDADKAKMIAGIYEAGAEKGKEQFLVGSGKVTKEAYAYSVLNDSQKAAVDERKITAVKLRALKDKAEAGGVKANGNGIAIALTLDGTSLKDMQAYSDNVSETAYTEAQQLKKQGYTASSFTTEHEKAKAKYDANGNGSLNKEEAMAYLATTNYSPEKKWALLAAMTQVTKNPY